MAKIQNINIDLLIPCPDNPRETLDEYSLVPSIREQGIKVPLLVMPQPDGTYMIVKGHRRHAAAKRIQSGSPASYDTHFSKGLPCEVMPKDTTPVQFALQLADHGESRTLSTDWELYLLCRVLTRAGLKREDVVKNMATVLNVAKPSRDADTIAKLNELLKIVEDPTADTRESVRAEMEYEELCVSIHTGIVQRFQSIAKLPVIAEAAFRYACTGVVPEGYTAEQLPKLKGDSYKSLYSSKDGYLKDCENGQADTHPLFNARFAELLEKQNGAKEGTTRKSRSRKEVADLRDGMESGIAKQILGFACNEPDHTESQVRVLDAKLQMLEWLESEKPDEFKALSKEFAAWMTAKTEALSETE